MDEFSIAQLPASPSSEPMAPADADPFAPLTDAERATPASDKSDGGTGRDDRDTLERLPCPQQGMTADDFHHCKYGLPVAAQRWSQRLKQLRERYRE